MQLALVSPKTIDQAYREFPTHASPNKRPEIPLGTITAAGVLEKAGYQPRVFDLNFLPPGGDEAIECWARHLAAEPTSLFGFGTICSSYPYTLRIATALKKLRQDATIFLAGPQASVVDVATLKAFPAIDLIIRGEVEESLLPALESYGRPAALLVPGTTFRSGSGVQRNANGPVILDLDQLPAPAFHLLKESARHDVLPVEAGRGCPFSCTFCSTNDFFRRKFRLRSPERIIAEMDRLAAIYPARAFDLVHDMFTVDRRKVADFCRAMRASGRDYEWTCSARTDCVDRELLDEMYASGCRGVFFGVESGSARTQQIIDKGLDLDQAIHSVRHSANAGMQTVVAFITGFPDERREDLEGSLRMALRAARSKKAEIQFSLLAPLAGTPILKQFHDKLIYDGNISSMSTYRRAPDPEEEQLIRNNPDIFPNFYGIPAALERSTYSEANRLVSNLANKMRWLGLALEQETESLVSLTECWRRFEKSQRFKQDFLRFLRPLDCGPKTQAALAYYEAVNHLGVACDNTECSNAEGANFAMPKLSRFARLDRFGFNLQSVFEKLESGEPLSEEDLQPHWTLIERRPGKTERHTLLPDPGAALVNLCDGVRSRSEIVTAFAKLYPVIESKPGRQLAEIVLKNLVHRKTLV